MEDNQQCMINYLQKSNFDIFDIIKSAITVAASDHPKEFLKKRETIAKTLFSCALIKCSGCRNCENKDETTTTVAQVLKMKAILDQSSSDECVLVDSLSKLQDMVKSVDVLKVTGVGISVNALRYHPSKHVVMKSRKLVREWKLMVDKWMKDSHENMHHEQKGTTSDQQETNPPRIEKQVVVPTKRSLVIRIKLKKDHPIIDVDPKGPVTPEQKVDEKDNVVARVLRIKGIIDEKAVSESVVLESLKKLQGISLSIKTLEATGIGRSVRALQKHGCKDVRETAWRLVKEWKGVVDEYLKRESSLKAKREMERVDSKKGMTKEDEGMEEKLKASVRKFREAYEEEEKRKKKRRIQVIEPFQLINKPQVRPLKRMTRR